MEKSPEMSDLLHGYIFHLGPFSNQSVGQGLMLVDQYLLQDTPTLMWQVCLTLIYFVSLPFSLIVLVFVGYEMQGLASNYRTLINQLLSFQNGLAVFFAVILMGVDILNVWLGSLPMPICGFACWSKNVVSAIGCIILAVISIQKFFTICVWKSMRVMNDDLIARIVIVASVANAVMLTLASGLGPGGTDTRCLVSFIYDFQEIFLIH